LKNPKMKILVSIIFSTFYILNLCSAETASEEDIFDCNFLERTSSETIAFEEVKRAFSIGK
jgi:hypothetical protein